MNGYGRFILPAAVAFAALAYLVAAAAPPTDPPNGMHLHQFGKLPIIDKGSGRIKPIEAAARQKLMLISGRQVFYDELNQEHSAMEWELDALTSEKKPFHNPAVYEHRVFRIENDEVLKLLNLEPRPGSYRYSLAEIMGRWSEFLEADKPVEQKREADQKLDLYEQKLADLADHIKVQLALAEMDTPLLVNPADPTQSRALGDVLASYQARTETDKNAAPPAFLTMLLAYERGDAETFNSTLDAYQKQFE
ncbi:MAG TPA: hypothetical protein VMS17_07860, partial [Gemmataceae bacterium]|nr:hypothetical protein [Gemmataceae bacterium]